MEKQQRWIHKVGGAESLWISKVGHTVLTKLMEFHIWHQPTDSVRGRLYRGTMASACPNARHFSFFLYTTGALQAATPVLKESECE